MNEEKYPSVIISGLGISGLITASLLCKEKIKGSKSYGTFRL